MIIWMLALVSAGPTYDDPYKAYAAGAYDRALELFLDAQVDRPRDPRLGMNIGNAYYKLGDFAHAEAAYTGALSTEDRELRARALYNLGNTAFRQQKLEAAIEKYEAALQLAP